MRQVDEVRAGTATAPAKEIKPMTVEEIEKHQLNGNITGHETAFWLKEIAAQLAKLCEMQEYIIFGRPGEKRDVR